MSRISSYCSWWKLVLCSNREVDKLIQFNTGSYIQLLTQHLHLEVEWTSQTGPKPNFQSLCHPTSLPLTINLLPLHLSPSQFIATQLSHDWIQKHLWCLFLIPYNHSVGKSSWLSLQNIFRFHLFSPPLLLSSWSIRTGLPSDHCCENYIRRYV